MQNDRVVLTVFAAVALLLLAVPPIVGAILDNVAVGVAIDGMLVLFGIVLASYTAGARFTRSTMAMGSDLVLRAQESDDRRDIKQMEVFGRLMIEGGRIAQRMRPNDAPAALPLPSQEMKWLPEVTTYDVDDIVDGDLR